ncbi:MAG: PPOX class F420-dependent oxidoreductase [Chloroflexota bacterium]
MTATTAHPDAVTWENVDRTGYLLLTTWKKDGAAVSVPVWAVRDGGRLLVITAEDSGKAKRIRANGRAAIAPSDRRGTRLGPDVPARGRQLPHADVERLRPLFVKRYGMFARLIFGMHRVRFRKMTSVLLELLPAAA